MPVKKSVTKKTQDPELLKCVLFLSTVGYCNYKISFNIALGLLLISMFSSLSL